MKSVNGGPCYVADTLQAVSEKRRLLTLTFTSGVDEQGQVRQENQEQARQERGHNVSSSQSFKYQVDLDHAVASNCAESNT